MTCTYFVTDTLYTLTEKQIEEHIKLCIHCAERVTQENQLIQRAALLNPVHPPEYLWNRIEQHLDKKNPAFVFNLFSGKFLRLSVAAVLLLLTFSAYPSEWPSVC